MVADKMPLECPVDLVQINENKARLTALLVCMIVLVYTYTGFWVLAAFLTVDFFLRAAGKGRLSLLGRLSEVLVKVLRVAYKPTDQGPKRFAAMVGVVFAGTITMLSLAGFGVTAIVLALVLALFAFLESAIGFCAGCYAYTLYKRIFTEKPLA